jgi:quercetin dioxygenase-like cupin family protein
MAELINVGAMQLRFLRTKYDTSGALDMFEVVIPPNSRMPVPHHHRDWEETIYGLEGIVTWTVAGKRIEIKPGDDLFIPRGIVHGFVNETQAIAKMLCVLTPGVSASASSSSESDPKRTSASSRMLGLAATMPRP